MSEGSKPQAPVPSGRPSGDRRSQRLACMEDLGVRRSGRSRSNVASVSPESVESRRGRKAESRKADPSTSSAESGPSGAQRKPSVHGGEADLEEEGWGVMRARESISTYGSRVMSHLREYEDASKTLRRLREELRGLRACIETAPKRRKQGLQSQIKQLQAEIGELEERRTVLREKSGPFKEKLLNEERFQRMAEEKQRRLMGLQPESQVEEDQAVEEDGDGDQQDPPGSLQEQVPYSGPPARQAAMSPSCGSEDEYETCSPGGALMEEIQLLESPVRFQDLCFGDELPPETPGGGKTKKAKKTKPQEQVRFVYTPLPGTPGSSAGPAHCISPSSQPSPCPAVDSVQERGESKVSNMAGSSVSVCSNRDGAGAVLAEKPDRKVAVGVKKTGSGAGVCSLLGGGGSSAPESAARAPVAPIADDAAPSGQKRHEGAAGAETVSPPTKGQGLGLKPLFCIGAAGPDERRHERTDQQHMGLDQRRPIVISDIKDNLTRDFREMRDYLEKQERAAFWRMKQEQDSAQRETSLLVQTLIADLDDLKKQKTQLEEQLEYDWMSMLKDVDSEETFTTSASRSPYTFDENRIVDTTDAVTQMKLSLLSHALLEAAPCPPKQALEDSLELSPGSSKPRQQEISASLQVKPPSRLLQWATTVSFDPDTVSCRLSLSSDLKTVTVADKNDSYPKKERRFLSCQALCSEGFSTGCTYWEVGTADSDGWGVGVAASEISRSRQLGDSDLSWCVKWNKGHLSAWHKNEEIRIPLPQPSMVGVLLDCTEKILSFYSVSAETEILIHTFRVHFQTRLFPAVWLYGLNKGKSLTIRDVKRTVTSSV